MAAITRQADVGDGALNQWLRADPVYVRPDMTGARLMAWGNLGLSRGDAESFLQALRPIFGDAGLPLSAPSPERWYVALARDSRTPEFVPPVDALGQDLLELMPAGPEGRRWLALLNEAQVTLHNHPLNRQRAAAGLLPVNSLWLWGGGMLPDAVTSPAHSFTSRDPELRALAGLAGIGDGPGRQGLHLVDLRAERDWPAIERTHLGPPDGSVAWRESLVLDFADGVAFHCLPGQRWRFWRKPLKAVDQ